MKKIAFFVLVSLTFQVQAQNIFSPFRGLVFPRLRAVGTPAPQQPQPAPAPQTKGSVSPTAVAVGAAVGGVIGSNSEKTTEGTAIGGAIGLLIGQMLDNKAVKKAEARRQTPEGPLSQGPAVEEAPQIDPVTGLPIDPNNPVANNPPAIDPVTGLPVGVVSPNSPAAQNPSKPVLSPRKRVNRLFGR